jgi:phosphomannomutase/GT2 family glycosyltransferase
MEGFKKVMDQLACFKAYDIRGQLGTELNEDIAYRIGRAYAVAIKPKKIVVGGDARATSEALKLAVARGLQDGGCDVIDIGMVGTEEIYFATSHLNVDGGIEVTASHNPIDYNGMKLVREHSKPISGDTGLKDIQRLAEQNSWSNDINLIKGSYSKISNLSAYVEHLLTYITASNIKPLKLVVNSGNGAAGHVIDALESAFANHNIPIQFIKVHHNPDATFPNGIPNPLLPENRADTANAVKQHNADMGIAWDGDFDRCFLFDETGEFIEGYYIVGLLAEAFLVKNPGEKIIFDPRVYWNTVDIVESNNGIPVMSKTGHAFIKERMRKEDAIYGGEMSAHHYFRDFAYCDSGMIPWLLVAELLSIKSVPLSSMVKQRIAKYPSSGEINRKVNDADITIAAIEKKYATLPNARIDNTDGLGIEFPEWRFNLRQSNTEPLIRLNVESKRDIVMMTEKTQEILRDVATSNTVEPALKDNIKGPHLHGNIEGINAGDLEGWAASKLIDKPLHIKVLADNTVIGSGVANIFRPDLKQNGIHSGNHKFTISLASFWSQESKKVKLELVDAESNEKISHSEFIYEIKQRTIKADIVREQHGHLLVDIGSDKELGNFIIQLYHNDKVVAHQALEVPAKDYRAHIALPISLIDGNTHLFKVGIVGYPDLLAMGLIKAQPVQTPWQYIKESYLQPGFMSLPKQASHRYESLEYQLEAVAKDQSPQAIKDVMIAHKAVVEGYEARSKYPKFSLPKFDKPRVSIIVPAYNKFELTYHCIASIALAFNKTSYEVILADDCSTDETVDAENIIQNVVISRNTENLRFLRSCNRASNIAKGEFIIMLNNDTEVTSFWIDELINKLDEDQTIGMTGSKLLNLDGSLQEAGGIVWENGQPWNVGRDRNPMTPEFNYAREVDYLTGAAMCIRTSLWEQVGRFSEELVPCYYEDTDIAFKVRDAGYKTVYVPHSQVVHFEGQSHGTDVTKGLKRYQVINEQTFRSKWFKAFRNNGTASLENMMLEKDRNIDQRILVIDYASPMPNKDAGSYAAIQEIKLIQSLGFKVTFVPENMAHFGKYTIELQRMGVEVLYAPFYTSVHDVLNKRLTEMDAVYITRYAVAEKYIDYIQQHSQAKVLFNNADLHFLRELRTSLRGEVSQEGLEKALETRTQELAVCQKADAILCYNATEHAVITSHILDVNKLHITPWVLEPKSVGPAFEQRQGIAFLGGFNHFPNVEAVEYLAKDIMPLLYKQRPDITLYVYGSNMPASLKQHDTDNIKMLGFAETLDGVYHDHRVFVAPLLSGAGIKGKVLEAMAYGTPTILTEVAAEGTGLTQGISTLIAQEPQEWVDAIIKLYDDKLLCAKFTENEQILVAEKYSVEHGHKAFKKIFASVGVYSSK